MRESGVTPNVTEAFERMPPRTRVRGIAATSRSRPSQGFSRQVRIMTSNSDDPARSITRKPVLSISAATGSAMPACIRMPQRLCWPSRMVSSRNSMWAISGFLWLTVLRQKHALEPSRVDLIADEVRMLRDAAEERNVGRNAVDNEGFQRRSQPLDGGGTVGRVDD